MDILYCTQEVRVKAERSIIPRYNNISIFMRNLGFRVQALFKREKDNELGYI